MKVYIVTETGFEYNDEVYSTSGDGGIPISGFRNKEEAEKYSLACNLEKLKTECLGQYCYDLNDLVRKDLSFDFDLRYFLEYEGIDFREQDQRNLSLDKLKKVYDAIYLCFFQVTEIEMEEV